MILRWWICAGLSPSAWACALCLSRPPASGFRGNPGRPPAYALAHRACRGAPRETPGGPRLPSSVRAAFRPAEPWRIRQAGLLPCSVE
eukprot:12359650-Alexandrium_andersonii.AAC.1